MVEARVEGVVGLVEVQVPVVAVILELSSCISVSSPLEARGSSSVPCIGRQLAAFSMTKKRINVLEILERFPVLRAKIQYKFRVEPVYLKHPDRVSNLQLRE